MIEISHDIERTRRQAMQALANDAYKSCWQKQIVLQALHNQGKPHIFKRRHDGKWTRLTIK